MKLFSFKGGIHPKDRKKETKDKKIVDLAAPSKAYISLLQHIGAELLPIVKVGDNIKIGQKIADNEKAFLSVPIHSSISGKVIEISKQMHPINNGFINTIVIENDNKFDLEKVNPITNYKEKSRDELLKIIREAGVVGKGGATFPTHIKLTPPKDKPIDTLIINGAECEPYLNVDYRAMLETPDQIIKGIEILMYILDIKTVFIAIENNKPAAIEIFSKKLKNREDIKVAALETKYPQGGEKQIIKAILKREVPMGKLPSEVGIVVQNIVTVKSVYDAIILGKPVIDSVITLAGMGMTLPKNIRVKIGTRFSEVLEAGKIDRNITEKIVMGGPMMGLTQYDENIPVLKGTTGILALTKKEINKTKPSPCINCGKCIKACSMKLEPLMYVKMVEKEEWDKLEDYYLTNCIECGCCSYLCPSARPLMESIKIGKAKLRELSSKREEKSGK